MVSTGGRWLFFVCLSLVGQFAWGETTFEDVLRPEDYRRVMRAIILAESRIQQPPQLALLPLGADCALMECGNAQLEMAYLLMKQKVPPNQIKMIQTQEMFGERGVNDPLTHAALVYSTTDREGKTIHLVLDPTFLQFANPSEQWADDPSFMAGVPLAQSWEGGSLLEEVSRYGMWKLTDERLALLNEAFTMDGEGRPHVIKKVTIADLPKASYHDEDMERVEGRPAFPKNYIGPIALKDALERVDDEAIRTRVINGSVFGYTIRKKCQAGFRRLRPPE